MRHLRKEIKALLISISVILLIICTGLAEGALNYNLTFWLLEIGMLGISLFNLYILNRYN